MPKNGFSFEEETHTYTFDGVVVPSPSTVFQDLGLVDSKWFKPEHRARGRAVHAGLHYALKGTLDWASLNPALHGFVKSGLRLVDHMKPNIVRYETPLYHVLHRFAGTSDIQWELNGYGFIIDWKSGKAPKVARYQTAAYAMLAQQDTPRVFKRAAVELQADGSMANLIKYYDDRADAAGWLSLLNAFRIRQSLRSKELPFFNPAVVVS